MESKYWSELAQMEEGACGEAFQRIRELYYALLKHLYDNPRDIPDFHIYFSLNQKSEEDGLENGYEIAMLSKRSREITEMVVHDVTEIPNFENSYTWYQDNVFVIFDYSGSAITPLQFITRAFYEEVYKQMYFYGIERFNIVHMYELIIYGGVVEFFYGFYKLDINFLMNLSAETYEHNYADCRIILPRNGTRFTRKGMKQGLSVVFSEPVSFSVENRRQIRKLLELSNETLALVVDENGKVRGLSDKRSFPNECEIRIRGHLSWRILYEGMQNIAYYNARYHIGSSAKKELDISELIRTVDDQLSPVEMSRIASLITDAAHQKYGTILVFGKSDDIHRECERLTDAGMGIGIAPLSLDRQREILPSFMAIDGGLLLDTRCCCHCIGAILDGDAGKGSMARGARFNSSLNYIRRRNAMGQNFVAIVISEDGTTDAIVHEKITRLNV